ncbi:hypothetical protein L3X38_029496 [Prunus dulcis]|uniref:Pentatricopeptide repeat superfamily protein n=1 Tax=Prunus dulcis TaxID=3755 RepID=A0AAD4Z2H7_PRUDU|nr:hypothetical protein L3X38_029487 [Prunus dulcis]KAI5330099.1 hypothetical protein L3X38_029496 [Prunus dulcis]
MFGEAGDYDGIRYVLQEMTALGVQPNLVMYNTLLEAIGKAGKPETDPQMSKCGQVTPATLESTIRSEKIDSCKLLDESPQRAALFSPVHNALIDLAI